MVLALGIGVAACHGSNAPSSSVAAPGGPPSASSRSTTPRFEPKPFVPPSTVPPDPSGIPHVDLSAAPVLSVTGWQSVEGYGIRFRVPSDWDVSGEACRSGRPGVYPGANHQTPARRCLPGPEPGSPQDGVLFGLAAEGGFSALGSDM